MGTNNYKSFSENLFSQLQEIKNDFIELLNLSTLERYIDQGNQFAAALGGRSISERIRFRWIPLPHELEEKQIKISHRFEKWYLQFEGLLIETPEQTKNKLHSHNLNVASFIKYRTIGKNVNSNSEAVNMFEEAIKPFFEFLNELINHSYNEIILIPDTNVIIEWPNVEEYGSFFKISNYLVIFTSTVIGELDDLKIKRLEKDFHQKVTDAIHYLYALHDKGDVINGVKLNNGVTAIMRATDPNFSNLPSWINPNNNDDKIIGSVLELQREKPGAKIIVISNDINMNNKCSLANIPCIKLSKP
jgi:hypothetical protein